MSGGGNNEVDGGAGDGPVTDRPGGGPVIRGCWGEAGVVGQARDTD